MTSNDAGEMVAKVIRRGDRKLFLIIVHNNIGRGNMMRADKIAPLLILMMLPMAATAAPDEASGIVVSVIDGKTFEILIEKSDPRIGEIVERVTLADVLIPEVSMRGQAESSTSGPVNEAKSAPGDETIEASMNGSMEVEADGSTNGSIGELPSAKDFAVAILLNKTVWLDIDDRSPDGRNCDGELVAVLRLSGLDGRPVISPTFNRMLVDYGIAEVNDSDENEFDPSEWWPAQDNGTDEDVSGEGADKKTTGLNVKVNPTKPNVNVSLSGLNVNINPTRPNVNVSLSGLEVNVNPNRPKINVNPKKPVIDVNPGQPNVTENETEDPFETSGTVKGPKDTDPLQIEDESRPVIFKNLTGPITLIDPAGAITVINSTGEVTVIDPAIPVKIINTSDIGSGPDQPAPDAAGDLNETAAANLTEESPTSSLEEEEEEEDPAEDHAKPLSWIDAGHQAPIPGRG